MDNTTKIKTFVKSGKDEIEFFNLKEDKSNLITIEEVFDNYTDDYHKLLEEIKTMQILLERKNSWAREMHIMPNKNGLSFSEDKKSSIILTSPKKMRIVDKLQLQELLRIYKLKSNSKDELTEIFKDVAPFLEKYCSMATISGKFFISHDDNNSHLFCIGNSKPILENNHINSPITYDYSENFS